MCFAMVGSDCCVILTVVVGGVVAAVVLVISVGCVWSDGSLIGVSVVGWLW